MLILKPFDHSRKGDTEKERPKIKANPRVSVPPRAPLHNKTFLPDK